MKLAHTLLLIFAAIAPACFFYGAETRPEMAIPQQAPGNRSPVLVELFTSEGCSSCPPADALLAKLELQQPVPGAEVIALEEHVDYWNQQGWMDPFSSEQWTERQQRYAAARHDEGIYTPQMVINGRAEFVGSRERQARQEIEQAAQIPLTKILLHSLAADKKDAERFSVSVGKLSISAGDTAEVWFAVTESGLHSAVARGENAGTDVHHAAVVRWLHKLGPGDPGKEPSYSAEPTVKLDRSWNRHNLRAIVFVQEKRGLRILGAAAMAIESESAVSRNSSK